MKHLYLVLAFIPLIFMFVATSCNYDKQQHTSEYPKYSLKTISYVPDSLKKEHREYLQETIRATNQHLSAGDYEDVDDVVYSIRNISNELFEVKVLGLVKEMNDNYWEDFEIVPEKMTDEEKLIFNNLQK